MSLQAAKSSPATMKSSGRPGENKKKRRNKSSRQKQRAKQLQKEVRVDEYALRNARNRTEYFKLSPCSEEYLYCLTDPFNMEGGKACIPDLFDLPSFKALSIARGTMSVGTAQEGFVFVNPQVNSFNALSIIHSTSAWAGTGLPASLPSTGVTQLTYNQIPFGDTAFDQSGLQGRTVGSGIRIRYLGTELNRSGRVVPFRATETNANMASLSVASVLTRPEIPSLAVDRKWHTVCYLPTREEDNKYTQTLGGISSTNLIGANLGFFVSGSVASNSFEWEIYTHKEYTPMQGARTLEGQTPSHSDLAGMSAIRNVLETNLPIGEASDVHRHAKAQVEQYTPQDTSHMISGLVELGTEVLSGDIPGTISSGIKLLMGK